VSESGSGLEMELRRALVRFSRWMHRLGYMPGTSGNLSVRLDAHRLLVTPTGASKYLLRAADMAVVDLDGRCCGVGRKATSELGMHLAIYRRRTDVRAVVHAHPPVATAFACSGRALDEVLCQEAVMTLGPVPLACYATTGTEEVAASLAPLVRDHVAILLANHGAVCYGDDLLEAFMRMETLEHLAQVHLAAHQLGTARPLERGQVDQLHGAKERYLRNAS
jgi:L-fuculose-phosphate aldolase